MYIKWGVMLCLGLLLLGCQKEEFARTNPIFYKNVDVELTPYFLAFEQEAASRGWVIDLTSVGVTGVIQEISQESVAGQCNYNTITANRITIDRTFFEEASTLYREFVIFHELGHCVLGRGHDDSTYTDGGCVSIMRSGVGECRDNYSSLTRSSYLDELFAK